MRSVIALALLAADLGGVALAADPPKVVTVEETPPAKWVDLKAKAGRPLTLKADKPGHWTLVDDSTAALIADAKPSDTCRLVPFGVGCHKVIGYDPADPSNPARIAVQVGDVPTPMPPTPVPPTPPVPPADPLTAKVQEAFKTDTPTDPAERLAAAKNLASFYKTAAGFAQTAEGERLSDVVKLVNETSVQMVKGQLPGVRAVFRDELRRAFPTDGELTADVRAKLADVFHTFEKSSRTLTEK